MKLEQFETLADAHEHFTTRNITKNEAINHDMTFGVEAILDEVIVAIDAKGKPPTAEDAIILRAAKVFRKIINGIVDDINILDPSAQMALYLLVQEGTLPNQHLTNYTQYMRDDIEAKAKQFHFASTTQEEFDAAKAKEALYVTTQAVLVGYPQLDGSNTNAVISDNKKVRITAIRRTVLPVDSIVTVFFHSDDTSTKNFTEVGTKIGVITIPANVTSNDMVLNYNNSGMTRYTKFSFECNVSGEFDATVATL